jgi:hypothetical protein
MDIVKLYGAGIQHFVPDEAFHHDFYKVANEIVQNLECELTLTIEGDSICRPCNRFNGTVCTDPLIGVVEGYDKKDTYNKTLDRRILKLAELDLKKAYTARELLAKIGSDPDIVFQVWQEEDDARTAKRNDLFWRGYHKLIG